MHQQENGGCNNGLRRKICGERGHEYIHEQFIIWMTGYAGAKQFLNFLAIHPRGEMHKISIMLTFPKQYMKIEGLSHGNQKQPTIPTNIHLANFYIYKTTEHR